MEFITAIEINPKSPESYYNLGTVYARKQMYDESIAACKKAVEINPDFAEAYYNLGITYYGQREYSLAIEHFDRAIELGSSIDSRLLEFLEPYRKE